MTPIEERPPAPRRTPRAEPRPAHDAGIRVTQLAMGLPEPGAPPVAAPVLAAPVAPAVTEPAAPAAAEPAPVAPAAPTPQVPTAVPSPPVTPSAPAATRQTGRYLGPRVSERAWLAFKVAGVKRKSSLREAVEYAAELLIADLAIPEDMLV